MVSVRVGELSLGLVRLLPLTVGSEVGVGDCRQSQSVGEQEREDLETHQRAWRRC
jgi:hypothetical protein